MKKYCKIVRRKIASNADQLRKRNFPVILSALVIFSIFAVTTVLLALLVSDHSVGGSGWWVHQPTPRLPQPGSCEPHLGQQRHLIVHSALLLDRYDSIGSLQSVISQLILLAYRTNRTLVLPDVINGKIVAPTMFKLNKNKNSALQVIPEYFSLKGGESPTYTPLLTTLSHFRRRAGLRPSRSPQPIGTPVTPTCLVALSLHCYSKICGPREDNIPCGYDLEHQASMAANGWARIATHRCVAMDDFDPRFIENIITADYGSSDILLGNWNSNIYPLQTEKLLPDDLHLVTAPRLIRQASKYIEARLGNQFLAVYWPTNWTVPHRAESLAQAAFKWVVEEIQTSHREKHVVIFWEQSRQLGFPTNWTLPPAGMDANIWSSILKLNHSLTNAGFIVDFGLPSSANPPVDTGKISLIHDSILLDSRCKAFLTLNKEESWSKSILSRRANSAADTEAPLEKLTYEFPPPKRSKIAIFVPTVYHYHNIRFHNTLDTWLSGYEPHVWFLSDTAFPELNDGKRLLNVIDTGCPNNKLHGLWCRNDFMFRFIHKNWDNIFKDYEWFARFDDEALILMDNLVEFLDTQDYHQNLLVGEMYCHERGFTFVSGGPGYVMSRGFIQDFNFTAWIWTPMKYFGYWTDDIATGFTCKMTQHCQVVHHHGFSYAPGGMPWNQLYQWQWRLPYKVLGYHQTPKAANKTASVLQELNKINYSTPPDGYIDVPPCGCIPNHFSRCVLNIYNAQMNNCRYHAVEPRCIIGHNNV